jgi:hypothetical protein
MSPNHDPDVVAIPLGPQFLSKTKNKQTTTASTYHLDDVQRDSLICSFSAGAPLTRSWNAKIVLNVYIWGKKVGVSDPDPEQLFVEYRL